MKTPVTLFALFLVASATVAADRMAPLDKDIPLSESILKANEMFPDAQPLTEDEVIAAVTAIRLKHPDIDQKVHDTYMRVVKERVLPKGMYFSRITSWSTEYGRFQVDWKDLCLEGRVASADERKEMLSKMPSGMHVDGEVRTGGFGYRIRARFVSVDETPKVR